MNKPQTMNEICKAFSDTLKTELGVQVETTARGANKWTFSGTFAHACKAAAWLEAHGLMTLEGFNDEDPECVCAYMRS